MIDRIIELVEEQGCITTNAAMHAKTTDDWGCDAENFHDKATPDVVVALLDEMEAKDKQMAQLEARPQTADKL
ncbi:ead/Ea22-like family protein [Enterobacter asburiae]|uniref:ead/Ea22-like family protein n=1 Tax=Enterobacter asburiae TaxID=61645 RepID=UPI001F492A57|nr:ead/Ea22-like family protein [Enterobacter asburiae]